MAKERKPVHKVVMTEGKRDIIRQLLQEYDIQDALKDLLRHHQGDDGGGNGQPSRL